MSKQKYKEYQQYLQGDEPGYRDNPDVQEILNHLALILAEEYVEHMKRAA